MNLIPQRIVCLSAEVADWLWRIGAWDNVAGATAFFEQPTSVAQKPRVSGFSTARMQEIEALNPDLVITFSDVQADFAAELIKHGFPVLATNQRTLAETESTFSSLGRLVGREAQSEQLLAEFRQRLAPVDHGVNRPRVYFEEWNDPLISGIGWIGELIERAGGADIFLELRNRRAARERVVSSEQVRVANPEIIFASWCGKPVSTEAICSRPGWSEIAAVRAKQVFEIPSEDILQPGFRLVNGYRRLCQKIGQANG
jgi:iron complex transport system substrate-binding protein